MHSILRKIAMDPVAALINHNFINSFVRIRRPLQQEQWNRSVIALTELDDEVNGFLSQRDLFYVRSCVHNFDQMLKHQELRRLCTLLSTMYPTSALHFLIIVLHLRAGSTESTMASILGPWTSLFAKETASQYLMVFGGESSVESYTRDQLYKNRSSRKTDSQ